MENKKACVAEVLAPLSSGLESLSNKFPDDPEVVRHLIRMVDNLVESGMLRFHMALLRFSIAYSS